MIHNRITAATRYPSDPAAALRRAYDERDYCQAMGRIWFWQDIEQYKSSRLWDHPPIRYEDSNRYYMALDVIAELTKHVR